MEEKLQWNEGGSFGEGVGEEEGEIMKKTLSLTLYTYVRIPMPISVSCMGKGGGRRGKLTKCCVHVCHCHYELQHDMKL